MSFSVVILAAGNGTRFKSSVSKVLHEIAGLPCFMHVVNTSVSINPDKVVLVTDRGYNTNKFTSTIPNLNEVFQDEKLGSGHALQLAFNYVNHKDDYIFLLYGDTPLIKKETLEKSINLMKSDADIANVIIAMEIKEGKEYGCLILDDNGYVDSILEHGCEKSLSNLKRSNLYNAGLLIRKNFLDKFLMTLSISEIKNEILVTDLISIATENGYKNKYIKSDENELIGINTRSDLYMAEVIFQDRLRDKFLNCGVTLKDRSSAYFSYDTEIGSDVTIYPDVYIGKNVTIEDNVSIYPFCFLEDVIIRKGAKVGPFARVRGNCVIGENAEIGNFVEIKKSFIGYGSKVKHLSYIGDTKIGKKANIGAGTVTCNYDGVKKFSSSIGDNVFIGSNTCIISPVNIADNSMTAACTVVTDDLCENDMAISRQKQTNVKDGALKYFLKRRK